VLRALRAGTCRPCKLRQGARRKDGYRSHRATASAAQAGSLPHLRVPPVVPHPQPSEPRRTPVLAGCVTSLHREGATHLAAAGSPGAPRRDWGPGLELDGDWRLWMVGWAGGGLEDEKDGEAGPRCGFGVPPTLRSRGHHRSHTCVKSRAQVMTGEQQMLHLRDGSRTAPDELEFTSEPQQQSSSRGSKHRFHSHAPSTRSCLHTSHLPLIVLIATGRSRQARADPLRDLCIPQTGARLFPKQPGGYRRQPSAPAPRPPLPPPPNRSQEAETSPEENSSSRNRPLRSSFKWLSDPFKQI